MERIIKNDSFCCDNKMENEIKEYKSNLPDYDAKKGQLQIRINAWYSPNPTEQAFTEYKECGFNHIFLIGNTVGELGDPRIEQALALCDKFDIKAFIDCGNKIQNCFDYAKYNQYRSFVGFNIDEPMLYYNTVNHKQGITEMKDYIDDFNRLFPWKCFLVNMNPTTSLPIFKGDAKDYDEYIQGVCTCILENVKNGDKWLSVDDYPIMYEEQGKKYHLKPSWLGQLEYMAHYKKMSDDIKTNMFIQVMSYYPLHERAVTVADIKLQLYCCLAFHFDMLSYFCYHTPALSCEFSEKDVAIVDRNGKKQSIWDDVKQLNSELKRFEHIYMQFRHWQGAYTLIGTNNRFDGYRNETLFLRFPLEEDQLGELKSITSTEDCLITLAMDDVDNCAYTVVNYNETMLAKKNVVTMQFKNACYAQVFKNGNKRIVELKDHKLTVHLDVGEGIYVIPD